MKNYFLRSAIRKYGQLVLPICEAKLPEWKNHPSAGARVFTILYMRLRDLNYFINLLLVMWWAQMVLFISEKILYGMYLNRNSPYSLIHLEIFRAIRSEMI